MGAPDGEGVATLKSKGPVQEIGEGEGGDDEDDERQSSRKVQWAPAIVGFGRQGCVFF